MTGLSRFSFGSLPVSTWRNGGGETREIISWPLGLPHFDWRVSIATIATDGPFSRFEDIDRSITLLSGAGVLLSAEGGIEHSLDRPAEPFAFAGETAIQAHLINGITTDFNVMTRRGQVSARVLPQHGVFTANLQRAGMLYVLQGQWQAGEALLLSASEGVYWTEEHALEQPADLDLEPLQTESLLLWVEIRSEPCKAAAN
ncbi:cold-shock protein [Enterobacterales bacterium]|nr:cold-shock protein [Enterobacterales bacterium]